MSWSREDIPRMDGRVAVVTGANGGLGLATADALAGRGAHVVMAARNQTKAADARDEILAAHPDASLEVTELDLGSLASVERAAKEVLDRHDQVDVLVCNAGLMATPEGTTEEGFETQFGVNHLGHWALTSHLLPQIVRTPGARVVAVTSVAQHQCRRLRVDDPHLRGGYDPWAAYAQSKLANRLFAVGIDRRFREAGVDAKGVVAHPGLTHSDLQARAREAGGAGFQGEFFHRMASATGMHPERGALSQLRASADPDVEGGTLYGPLFVTNGPPVRKPMLRPGVGPQIDALWELSKRETGLDVDVRAALGSG